MTWTDITRTSVRRNWEDDCGTRLLGVNGVPESALSVVAGARSSPYAVRGGLQGEHGDGCQAVGDYTTGIHPGAYSLCQPFMASVSPTMRPDAESIVSLRPTFCAMLPRWQSNTLLAPTSIGA